MAYDIVEGRFVTHMHNRSNWRLRDMNEHTIDHQIFNLLRRVTL